MPHYARDILFCVLAAILLVIIWFFFPEPKGHSLEEIAVLCKGRKALADMVKLELLELESEKRNGNGRCTQIEIADE